MSHDYTTISHDCIIMPHDYTIMSHDCIMMSHDCIMMSHDYTLCHMTVPLSHMTTPSLTNPFPLLEHCQSDKEFSNSPLTLITPPLSINLFSSKLKLCGITCFFIAYN